MTVDQKWFPDGTAHYEPGTRPAVGDVVPYGRRAWTVTHIADDDLRPEEEAYVQGYTAAWREKQRPYLISLRRLHGAAHERENSAGDLALRVSVRGRLDRRYPNGRVPLCSCCGHPWPCLAADQERQAEKELEAAERELALMPGCCPACGEPVTSRQRGITFEGPNVRNPLASNPTFHLRQQCQGAAARYEDSWVAADPRRKRSLLTLRCSGTVIVHADGTGECFGADAADGYCPSIHARHRAMYACYTQTLGCGRDCSREGHPGTRLVGAPADPREGVALW